MFDETDSIASHVDDTLIAGAGLCDKEAVEFIAGNARHCVQWLIDQGVLFDTEVNAQGEEHYHLTREGGHSHRRILHAADATGKEVETTLVGKASAHPNICVMERRNAVDLITSNKIGLPGTRRVVGAYVWNRELGGWKPTAPKRWCWRPAARPRYTNTPPTRTSPPVTASPWHGAPAAGSPTEFNQFHPTCLFHPQARNFLLTEALRGEGAYLKRPDGSRFMPDVDPRGELARAISSPAPSTMK